MAITGVCSGQSYQIQANLLASTGDKVKVEIRPEQIELKEYVYHMPRMVPGTYDIYDFGQYIQDFRAFDEVGREIPFEHPDLNTWVVSKKPYRLEYFVNDTWDYEDPTDIVFEPAGSNIEAGQNFVVNNHCFFGFFKGAVEVPYQVTFIKPDVFYGSTALKTTEITPTSQTFRASGYFELMDSPIMFCVPDTAHLNVGGADVLVTTYAPGKMVNAKETAKCIQEVLNAQKEYLGGKLPVDHYAFIIYYFGGFTFSGAYGALEHNYCSFYYLPESDIENLSQTLKDFTAHEFFHIVTPLNIHADQIHNFDYMNPTMSEHLWLYEGVTEYSSMIVQVRHQLITQTEFLDMIAEKIYGADEYSKQISFTDMSKGVLGKYKDEYGNVYQKGALIGLCLDLLIRKNSNGARGLKDLMSDLSTAYGKEKAFKDEELFEKIESLTYPEVGKFLWQCVDGTTPLPLNKLLSYAGVEYHADTLVIQYSIGNPDVSVKGPGAVVSSIDNMDGMGFKLGYQVGDQITMLNSTPVDENNFNQVLDQMLANASNGQAFTVTLQRKLKNGKTKKVILKSKFQPEVLWIPASVTLMRNPTAEQIAFRKSWMGNYLDR